MSKKQEHKERTERETIFDDVFRKIVEAMPFLFIPLINEVFETNYEIDQK